MGRRGGFCEYLAYQDWTKTIFVDYILVIFVKQMLFLHHKFHGNLLLMTTEQYCFGQNMSQAITPANNHVLHWHINTSPGLFGSICPTEMDSPL